MVIRKAIIVYPYYRITSKIIWSRRRFQEMLERNGNGRIWLGRHQRRFTEEYFNALLICVTTQKCEDNPSLMSPKALIKDSVDDRWQSLLNIIGNKPHPEIIGLLKKIIKTIKVDLNNVVNLAGIFIRDTAVVDNNSGISKWARTLGTFLGQYRVENGLELVNESEICTVFFATDVRD